MFITWLARRFASGKERDVESQGSLDERYIKEITKLRNGVQAYFDLSKIAFERLAKENAECKKEIKTIKSTIRENEIKNDPVLYRVTEILKEYGVIKEKEDAQ